MKSVALVLAHASQDDVNSPVSPRDSRTPLHLAASLGNLAMAQLLIWVSQQFTFFYSKSSTKIHFFSVSQSSSTFSPFPICLIFIIQNCINVEQVGKRHSEVPWSLCYLVSIQTFFLLWSL